MANKPLPKKLPAAPNKRNSDGTRGREVAGILALGASLFVLLAMLSSQAHALMMGPFGRKVAGLVYGIAGLGSYALVLLAVAAAVRSLMEKRPLIPWQIGVGVSLGAIAVAVMLQLAAPGYRIGGIGPGGAIGGDLAEVSRAMISTAGTAFLAVCALFIAVIVATPLRMRQVLGWIGLGARFTGRSLATGARGGGRFVADVTRAILPERDRDAYEDELEDEREDPMADG